MSLLIQEPPLQVLPSLAAQLGLNEAIILQQIHYWLQNPQLGKLVDGQRWIYNSLNEWHNNNFPFWSLDTIKRTLNRLRQQGILITANHNRTQFDRTLWYSIDYAQLETLLSPTGGDAPDSTITNTSHQPKGGRGGGIGANCPNGADCPIPLGQNAPIEKGNLTSPIPENTKETSSDDGDDADLTTTAADIDQTALNKLLDIGYTYRNAHQLCLTALPHFGPDLAAIIDEWWQYIQEHKKRIRSPTGFLHHKLTYGEYPPTPAIDNDPIPLEYRDIILR
ncbi:MAG TPA: hypothetical protein VLL52_13590 [Anaerolineae bacterium]|nr:hypothetical protein [Anaerolineae bacterium]